MMRIFAALLIAGAVSGCSITTNNYPAETAPQAATPADDAAAGAGASQDAPDTMQWLYGSGEAAGVSLQAWRQLGDYAVARARERRIPQSVAMGLDGELAGPRNCAADGRIKPLAVVFDVDETVLLNTGYEYWVAATGNSFTPETWKRWEESGASYIRPVPGAPEGLRRLREAGITPVFNTNRQFSPQGAAKAIAAAGLGTPVHRETLFLRGDDGTDTSDKDGRRALIAERFCVIALAGDNLGDFADIFNDDTLSPHARRDLTAQADVAPLWGNGWFVLPNPVYGDSLKGSVNDVYPEGTRWSPETAPAPAPATMNEGN